MFQPRFDSDSHKFLGFILVTVVASLATGCDRRTGGGSPPPSSTPGSPLTWSKTFGTSFDDDTPVIIPSATGEFLIVGESDDTGLGPSGIGPYLVHTDGAGDSTWTGRWRTGIRIPELTRIRAYGPTGDGGYVVYGNNPQLESAIVRIDDLGRRLWRRSVAGSGAPVRLGVDSASGRAYLAFSNPGDELVVQAIRADGPEDWILTYLTLPTPSFGVDAVLATDDGRVLIAYKSSNTTETIVSLDGLDGNVVWQSTFDLGENVITRAYDFRALDATRWTLGLWHQRLGDTPDEVIFYRGSRANGLQDQAVTIEEPADQSFQWGLELTGGGYLMVSNRTDPDPVRASLQRFDASGASVWEADLNDPSWDPSASRRAVHISRLDNGDTLVRGTISSLGFTLDPFVVRVSPDGTIVGTYRRNDGATTAALSKSHNYGDSYLIAGYADPVESELGAWLLELSDTLEENWQQAWVPSFEEQIGGGCESLRESGYVIIGGSRAFSRPGGSEVQATLCEITPDQFVRWGTALGFTRPGIGVGVVRTTDRYHGLIRFEESKGEEEAFSICQLNDAGELIRQASFETPEFDAEAIVAVNDRLWILSSNFFGQLQLLELDLELQPLQLLEFNTFDVEAPATLSGSDSGLLIAGSLIDGFAVVRLDATGAPLWSTQFSAPEVGGSSPSGALAPNGDVLLSATLRDPLGSDADLWHVRWDPIGSVLHQTRYASAVSDRNQTIAASPNGFAAIAGISDLVTGDQGDQWVLHVDANGAIADSCPSGIGTPTQETFEPYPFTLTSIPIYASSPLTAQPNPVPILLDPISEFMETSQCLGIGDAVEVTVTITIVGEGIVSQADPAIECAASCTVDLPLGSVLNLDAQPSTGWMFTGWSGDFDGTPIDLSGAVSVTASFEPSPTGSDPIIVSDSSFPEPQWSAITLNEFGGPTPFAYQMTGADPYRAMVDDLPIGSGVTRRHLFSPFTYRPQIDGAIASIDHSQRYRLFGLPPGGSLPPAVFGSGDFALVQGGRTHTLVEPDLALDTDGWQTFARTGLTPADFTEVAGVLPDFTTAGDPIQFGYVRSTLNDGVRIETFEHGIDDWQVTVHR